MLLYGLQGKKLQDAKLVIVWFGFSLKNLNSTPENDETGLSDKLTVLINDIGIAMKSMEYALLVLKRRSFINFLCRFLRIYYQLLFKPST